MPQSAAPEIRISEEVNLLRTAAYARLSSENSGHETEDTLNTQILQIHNYIKEHPELTLTDTYVDNGFTGTNFDRPEFERMMQDRRFLVVDHIDLSLHNINCNHLMMLAQKHSQRKPDVSRAGHGDFIIFHSSVLPH